MLHPYHILLPLFSLFLVRVDLTDLIPINMLVQVTTILDGDTLEVKKGSYQLRVRLSRLDAPEKKQRFYQGGSAGTYSRQCLMQQLSKHRSVMLSIEKHDLYGRILGDVDGLNLKAIQAGCSGLYPHAQFASQHEKALYLRALFLAKRMKKGIWARSGFQRPKLWRKLSKRFAHRQ